jgi:hypothetical protein
MNAALQRLPAGVASRPASAQAALHSCDCRCAARPARAPSCDPAPRAAPRATAGPRNCLPPRRPSAPACTRTSRRTLSVHNAALLGGAPRRAAAAPRGRRQTVVVQANGDYYDVLGVARGADKKTIKSAYRQKARKYHPVRLAGAPGPRTQRRRQPGQPARRRAAGGSCLGS